MRYKNGALIARMQYAVADRQIVNFITSLARNHDSFCLVLPCSKLPGSKTNPFDCASRKLIINSVLPELSILTIDDHIDDDVWSARLDSLLALHFGEDKVLIYGSEQRFATVYGGGNPVSILADSRTSGTLLPQKLPIVPTASEMSDPVFLKGMQYAYQTAYDKVYPTVDIAVFRRRKKLDIKGANIELLMGQKSELDKWRLPGGFADPADRSFANAASRELLEEAGPLETASMNYVCSMQLNDWRYRWERDAVITTLFAAEWTSGQPRAGDDLAMVDWISLDKLRRMITRQMIVPVHIPLIRTLINYFNSLS